jgi:hypothetical protein
MKKYEKGSNYTNALRLKKIVGIVGILLEISKQASFS